jgi:hypothetical protein
MKMLSLVILAAGLAQTAESRLDAQLGAVLTARDGRATLNQCSRPTPSATEFSTPDPATLRSLERKLADELATRLAKEISDPAHRRSVNTYYRQYVGIVAAGRRIVYINGFNSVYLDLLRTPRSDLTDGWRTHVVNVCDGGANFFGAEYDTTTGEIANFHFNGRG